MKFNKKSIVFLSFLITIISLLSILSTSCFLGTGATGDPVYDGVAADSLVTDNLDAPTGRGATYLVAASDAPTLVKDQADYVCDGTADNVEIQAAIDALPAPNVVYTNMIEGGGTVILSMGTFNIAAPVIIDQPAVTLKGMGTAATTLFAVPLYSGNIITMDSTAYANGLYQTHIQDMTIDGGNQTTGYGLDFTGARASYFSNIQFLHIKEYSLYANGTTKAVDFVTFDNIYSVASGKDAFYATGSVNQIYLNNFYVLLVGANFYGISLTGATTSFFIDQYTYDGGAPGQGSAIHLVGTTGSNIHIENSHFYGIQASKDAITNECFDDVTVYNTTIASGTGGTNSRYAFTNYGTNQTLTSIKFIGNTITGLWGSSIWCGGAGTTIYTGLQVKDNKLIASVLTGVVNLDPSATYGTKQISGNVGYLAPGEVRTYSGTIATLTENAYNSIDMPYLQSGRVIKLDIYVSTAATATTPNIDCGIGSSATTDYVTLFNDLPGETIGYYTSTIATPGTQTVPQTWETGGGNRYLNMSIKDAAATGMVATYTVTVMGN
jgi:hypothetical protein